MADEIPKDEVLMQENRNLQIVTKALSTALKDVFGEGVTQDRFLDKTRIPLICKAVQGLEESHKEMVKDIKEIKEMVGDKYMTKMEFQDKIDPIRKIVYGAVAIILTEVMVGIVAAAVYFLAQK